MQQELDVGLSLFFFFFFHEFKFEPEPERDQACPCSVWLQGFRLLLKSWALARYHRPGLNDCLVIGDATPPQPSSSPPLPPDTAASLSLSVRLRVTVPGKHNTNSTHRSPPPHLKLSDRHTFPFFYALRLAHSCPPMPKNLCWSCRILIQMLLPSVRFLQVISSS